MKQQDWYACSLQFSKIKSIDLSKILLLPPFFGKYCEKVHLKDSYHDIINQKEER